MQALQSQALLSSDSHAMEQLEDRKIKRYFSAGPSGAPPCKHPWGLLASPAGSRPWRAALAASPARSGLPAAAVRSKAWRGKARSGHPAQDGGSPTDPPRMPRLPPTPG